MSLIALVGWWLFACGTPPGPQPAVVDADAPPTAPPTAVEPVAVRILTWNVEGVGAAGTDERLALEAVLARLDADVVALNEIDALENGYVEELAATLGYDHVVVPADNPFGDLHNGVISRLPFVDEHVWTSGELSGDPSAEDLTRAPVAVTVDAGGRTLAIVSQHWQSGWEDSDEFRRAVDGIRTAQAGAASPADHLVVLGDMNHEIDEEELPESFTALPSGLPSSFWLGADLYDALPAGIDADPFPPLADLGLTPLDAQQADGRWDTRDSSGRRIDFLNVDDGLLAAVVGAVVYDSRDDDRVELPLAGARPDRDASALASDHFPVVAEFLVGDAL